jgi:hypothetical protein
VRRAQLWQEPVKLTVALNCTHLLLRCICPVHSLLPGETVRTCHIGINNTHTFTYAAQYSFQSIRHVRKTACEGGLPAEDSLTCSQPTVCRIAAAAALTTIHLAPQTTQRFQALHTATLLYLHSFAFKYRYILYSYTNLQKSIRCSRYN